MTVAGVDHQHPLGLDGLGAGSAHAKQDEQCCHRTYGIRVSCEHPEEER